MSEIRRAQSHRSVGWLVDTASGEPEVRTGRVWSSGPVAGSLWVFADGDPGHLVAVSTQTWRELPGFGADWQRDTIRRVEHVRSCSVFAVREGIRYRRHRIGGVTWHCDPGCPEAAGKQQVLDPWPCYGTGEIVDALLGRRELSPLASLCPRCIYQINPAVPDQGPAA